MTRKQILMISIPINIIIALGLKSLIEQAFFIKLNVLEISAIGLLSGIFVGYLFFKE